jgi:NAD-dependent dihydropyrimidine dehydrogenase PreA subunit
VDACPFGVRALVGGKVELVEPCYGCGACLDACPEQAILMRPS